MILHNLKDIVDIYYSGPDGNKDYTWDRTPIKIWNPDEQREMEIYFTGSERPTGDSPGKIHFNAKYADKVAETNVFTAFSNIIKRIKEEGPDKVFADKNINLEDEFIKEIVRLRNNDKK